MNEPDYHTPEQNKLLHELTALRKEVLALRILELTRICNVETGKVEALSAELEKGTDTLTLATKTMGHYRNEIVQLRTENERLTQAIGLMTTAKPDMEMNGPDPIGTAHKVVKEVTQLRASLSTAVDALERCDECLNEEIISAAIIKAEARGTSYAIDRDCGFITKRCKEKKFIVHAALAQLRPLLATQPPAAEVKAEEKP